LNYRECGAQSISKRLFVLLAKYEKLCPFKKIENYLKTDGNPRD
jgi:hypothetical protein